MGNSLKDQFLKAGLISSAQAQQAKQAQKEKPKQNIQQRRKQAEKPTPPADKRQQEAQRARERAAERDRQLNQQRKEAAERKAAAAQVKQLIDTHRVARDDADLVFNFVEKGKIRKINVTKSLRDQIVSGACAVVKAEGRYDVVPADAAEKIRARNEKYVVFFNDPKAPKPAEDDGYGDHPVPDDLMW